MEVSKAKRGKVVEDGCVRVLGLRGDYGVEDGCVEEEGKFPEGLS